MKKLLGIVVLGLLLSVNSVIAYDDAEKIYTKAKYHIIPHTGYDKQEVAARCGQKKKFFYYFKQINYPAGYNGEGTYAIICSRNLLEYDPIMGGPADSRVIHTNYNERQKNIWDEQDPPEEKKRKVEKASNEMRNEIEPLKEMCRNIGYSDGTEKFADCVKDLYLKKLDAKNYTQSQSGITSTPKRNIDPSVWDDLLDLSRGLGEGKSVTEALGDVGRSSSSSSSKRSITCFKTGEETGGLNKICRYDCVGNLVTTTVGAAQMCPIQIQR